MEHAGHYVYLAAGYILVFAAGGLLMAALVEIAGSIMDGRYTTAMVYLLALMLAEIIYAVRLIVITLPGHGYRHCISAATDNPVYIPMLLT